MDFDSTLRQRWVQRGEAWSFDMPAGWLQGRAIFGGLCAAASVALAKRNLDPDWKLRSQSVQFLRPLETGQVDGRFTLRRQGKGTTFCEVVLSQDGDAGASEIVVCNLVFVRAREGAMTVEAPPFVAAKSPDDSFEMPYIAGVTPEFTQHVAFRWAIGAVPFSGASEAKLSGFCKFRCEAGDIEGLVGLLDAWPCPSLSVLKAPTMASSVMWTAHIIDVPESFDGWFGFEYETLVGASGYHTVAGRLYAPSGELVGWTEQLVIVFA